MQRDLKTGHLSQTAYTQQAVEILTALKKLGEQLKPQEAEFLAVNTNAALSTFEKVSENIGSGDRLLKVAGSQVEDAQK